MQTSDVAFQIKKKSDLIPGNKGPEITNKLVPTEATKFPPNSNKFPINR